MRMRCERWWARARMQAQQADSKGWVLWLQWLLANVVGRGISYFASINIVSLVSDHRDQIVPNAVVGTFLAYVPFGFLFGLGIGTAQWLVLRKKLHSIRVWIWASVISWALGGIAGAVVDLHECPPGLGLFAHSRLVCNWSCGWIAFLGDPMGHTTTPGPSRWLVASDSCK
jgi:hypothetical protein